MAKFIKDRKILACMLISYVTERVMLENKKIKLPSDSIEIYNKCIKASESATLILDGDGNIDTGEMRNWARNWADDYYRKELLEDE